MSVKNIAYLNRRAPYGTSYPLESLESVLVVSAFEQNVTLIFIDDGVYQLLAGQCPDDIERKNLTKTYPALGDYGIERVYVSQTSLSDRGLNGDDLITLIVEDDQENEHAMIDIVSDERISQLLSEQHAVFSF